MNQGCECPKCGAVYAPWVAQCSRCRTMEQYRPKEVPRDEAVAITPHQPLRCPVCHKPTPCGETHVVFSEVG